MLEALDAGGIRRWAAACVQSLDVYRETIDGINVYPVPDGDTGTNMLQTMRSALDALLRADERQTAGAALTELSRGALAGACGNSGVITSQLLRGFAEVLRDADAVTGPGLQAALARGASLAWGAVAEPVAGTMLSVLDAAAAGARLSDSDTLYDVTAVAAHTAAEALDETPKQLQVLAEAGVVDAGGRGILVLLEALLSVVAQEPAAVAAAQKARSDQPVRVPLVEPENLLVTQREAGSDEYAYEVMYLLEDVAGSANGGGHLDILRDTLVGVGDCVSVAGDGTGLWTVHVHCNDIGAAIEAGIDAGRPRKIRVARFADARSPVPSRFVRDRAVVAPVRSAELANLLTAEGVAVLQVDAGEEATPYQLLEVITGTGAAHVTVLPADAGLMEIADEAAIRAVAAGQDVVVVPCSAAVQALAAVAVHDPRRRSGDDVVAMAEAAAATRHGEVVVATEDAITWIGSCRAGDVLGLADGEVMLIEPGPTSPDTLDRAACGVVERMLATGGELVTALLGADAPEELAADLEEFVRREHPEADLVVYRGGQTDAVLALGVE